MLDNLRRAVDAEASVQGNESDEFRHFFNGVDLIHKQLGGVLEALGVKPVAAEGELFDPHLHEAVLTRKTNTNRYGHKGSFVVIGSATNSCARRW